MTTTAPFIGPYTEGAIHRIAGHANGAWLHGNWYTLCGRIVPGATMPTVPDGEHECKSCATKSRRIFG